MQSNGESKGKPNPKDLNLSPLWNVKRLWDDRSQHSHITNQQDLKKSTFTTPIPLMRQAGSGQQSRILASVNEKFKIFSKEQDVSINQIGTNIGVSTAHNDRSLQ